MFRISGLETIQPKSLVEMTTKTIIKNLHSYGKNLVKLEPELKEMVLKHLLREYYTGCERADISDKAWLAYPSLLSRKTEEIDTYGFLKMFYQYDESRRNSVSVFPFLKVLKQLAGNATKLQKLIINHSSIYQTRWLGRKEIATLTHLKYLRRLHIADSIVLLSELKEIVKNCRGLQLITVNQVMLDCVEKVDFFDDGFLQHEIQFGSRDITIKLAKNISIATPHLVGPGPHYHLIGYPKKVENLEFLATQPHATALTMNFEYFWNDPEVRRFPRLPKLRSAKFLVSHNRTHALECFLKENGSHLSRLDIRRRYTSHCTATAELTLEQIFGWCSNLEWFSLLYLSLSSYIVPIGCLSRLKWFRCYDSRDMRVDIFSMLSAPQLEGFEIKFRNLDLGDKETLYSRIAQRNIWINQLTAAIESAMADDIN